MFNLNEYLKNNRDSRKFGRVPRIVCADGFSLSVQANHGAYSTPRDEIGPWNEAEIGFPSQRVEEIMPYCEDSSDPTGTVYAYVPVSLIEKLINDHGGKA